MRQKEGVPQIIIDAIATMLSPYISGINADKVKRMICVRKYDADVEKPFLIADVADLFSVSLNTVHRWIREGRLKKIKVGKRASRITAASVRNLLQQVKQ